jgi:hypothetical protein
MTFYTNETFHERKLFHYLPSLTEDVFVSSLQTLYVKAYIFFAVAIYRSAIASNDI